MHSHLPTVRDTLLMLVVQLVFPGDTGLAAVELLVGDFRFELPSARKPKNQRSSGSGPPIVV